MSMYQKKALSTREATPAAIKPSIHFRSLSSPSTFANLISISLRRPPISHRNSSFVARRSSFVASSLRFTLPTRSLEFTHALFFAAAAGARRVAADSGDIVRWLGEFDRFLVTDAKGKGAVLRRMLEVKIFRRRGVLLKLIDIVWRMNFDSEQ